jgi:hypothetical protein
MIVAFVGYINSLAYIVNVYRKEPEPEVIEEVNYINTLKNAEAESVLAVINAEGFDYAFNHYSTYRDINDTKFHDLRKAYIVASKELMDYITESAGKPDNIPYYLSYESRN